MRNLKDYQKNYVSLPFEKTQANYRKRNILESIEKYSPRSILEVGCGLDPIFNHYTHFETCTVIEPSDDFVRNTQEQAQKYQNITVVHGILEDHIEQLKTATYDMILLSSLLHEIPDCKTVLDATAQLCGSNTIVHVNVPNATSFHRLLALEMGLIESLYDQSPTQKRMQQSHTFDLGSLASLVANSGFKIVEQGSFFVKPFTHAQMDLLQTSGIITDAMLDGLYKMSKYFPNQGSEIFMNIQLRG